ncbi:MAG: PilZ domain-containing protein [Methylococcaceae bacterium]|jgi:hypothetical protein
MNTMLERSYRKNLSSQGLIFLAGQERAVKVKNLSISGVLIELCNMPAIEDNHISSEELYQLALESLVVDIFLPDMRLAGEADVVRVEFDQGCVLMALEFKNISHDVDNLLYKRKVYRKNMAVPGHILINGDYLEFDTVNVSVDGLMIQINKAVQVEENLITVFEFSALDLQGEARVVWQEKLSPALTLIGLQYVHMEKTALPGIPQFERIDVYPV